MDRVKVPSQISSDPVEFDAVFVGRGFTHLRIDERGRLLLLLEWRGRQSSATAYRLPSIHSLVPSCLVRLLEPTNRPQVIVQIFRILLSRVGKHV